MFFWLLGFLAFGQVGTKLSDIELKDGAGGLVAGGPWGSASLRGKTIALFYVDPDEKGKNEELEATLKAKEFDGEKFASVAVINLAATWLPNSLIDMSLRSKQKQYPRTIYVRDLNKSLVKAWNLTDDDYDALVIAKDGTLLFHAAGTLTKEQIATFVQAIEGNL